MTHEEAARILELPVNAPSDEIEARFLDHRRKLEDKLGRAPTPGLQEKYRQALQQLESAFEVLTLAADSTSLPVLGRAAAGPVEGTEAPRAHAAPFPATPARAGAAKRAPRPHNTEFIAVVIVAILVLGGGVWYVREAQERKRIADATAAEQRRAAEEAQAAVRARETEAAQLATGIRSDLAELNIAWEAIEAEARSSQTQLAELKSELRSARDLPAHRRAELEARVRAAQQNQDWLQSYVLRHPAKGAMAKAQQLVQDRAVDDAAQARDELRAAIASAEEEIPRQRSRFLTLEGRLVVQSRPAGLEFDFVDSFGREHSGKTPATLDDVAPGRVEVTYRRFGYATAQKVATVESREDGMVEAEVNQPISWTIAGVRITMQPIPAGSFAMGKAGGTSVETPVTEVTFTRPFWMGGTEVTQSQWREIMGTSFEEVRARTFREDERTEDYGIGPDYPMYHVTGVAAAEFCRRLNDRERAAGRLPDGYVYSLPGDAEWEYACRAGTTGDFNGPVQQVTNESYRHNRVAQMRPNAWGLCDMHGNVQEWCLDRFRRLPGGSLTDPVPVPAGPDDKAVMRGGSQRMSMSSRRSSFRNDITFKFGGSVEGFRVALVPASLRR